MEITDRQDATSALAIEPRSIDYVPLNARHGKVSAQGPFWFLGNLNFFTVAIGFIGPGMSLSFGYTCIASALGVLFGTFFMALHASQGPELGLPQMIQSRAQFGYRGVIIPLAGTLFTFLGFNVVDTVLVGQGLQHLLKWNIVYIEVVLGIVATLFAVFGYNALHLFFRILFYISLPLYVVLSVGVASGMVTGGQSDNAVHFSIAAFAAQFSACASYNITFSPYVSDYTRYLNPSSSRVRLIASVYLGAASSAIWLIVLGAWLASYAGATDGLVALKTSGDMILPHFGLVLVVASLAALVGAMALNAYSGVLTIITGLDSLIPFQPGRSTRVFCAGALLLFWLSVSHWLRGNATEQLYAALSLMLYLLVPWTAVNLADFFLVRRARYATLEFFKRNGIYGTWGWNGIASYAVGIGLSAPFFSLPGIFVGPLAKAIGGIDVAWAPGLLGAAGCYLFLMRRFRPSAEQFAISSSSDALESKRS